MAAGASDGVSIGQREATMIKDGWFPGGGGMTEATIRGTKLSFMRVILLMTGIAGGRSALENTVDMATIAGNIDMLTNQFKS